MDEADFTAVLSETHRFVRDRVVPMEAHFDEKDEVPAEIRQAARQMGLFGFALQPDPADHHRHGAPVRRGAELKG